MLKISQPAMQAIFVFLVIVMLLLPEKYGQVITKYHY
jgi:hypothetical protein